MGLPSVVVRQAEHSKAMSTASTPWTRRLTRRDITGHGPCGSTNAGLAEQFNGVSQVGQVVALGELRRHGSHDPRRVAGSPGS